MDFFSALDKLSGLKIYRSGFEPKTYRVRKIDTILVANGDYEAPNWHPDNFLVLNFRGKMYKLDLTTNGPDYSPDGKYIYFHSYRTGHMQIWTMHTDGAHPEQMTFDESSNWFAHPSPNNKWIAYIAYTSDKKQNHPFGKNVKLRLMDISTKTIKDITPVFFGGAGTINTPSWSPDNKKVAFVSYSVK